MKIASILENQKVEKRIAITPEIAKKYVSLGMEVLLPQDYGSHLGIKDNEYKNLVYEAKDELNKRIDLLHYEIQNIKNILIKNFIYLIFNL